MGAIKVLVTKVFVRIIECYGQKLEYLLNRENPCHTV